MKSSEEIKDLIWRTSNLADRTRSTFRITEGEPLVLVPEDLFRELVATWRWAKEKTPEGQFPVLYAGPGRHPDHPQNGCVGTCGHDDRCATHASPYSLDGPCDCGAIDA